MCPTRHFVYIVFNPVFQLSTAKNEMNLFNNTSDCDSCDFCPSRCDDAFRGILIIFLCWGEGVDIVFSADPVGVCVASSLHSISLMKGWVLAKLTQIYHWVGENAD